MKFEIEIDDTEMVYGQKANIHKALMELLTNTFPNGYLILGETGKGTRQIKFVSAFVLTKPKTYDYSNVQDFIDLWGILRGVGVSCAHVKE